MCKFGFIFVSALMFDLTRMQSMAVAVQGIGQQLLAVAQPAAAASLPPDERPLNCFLPHPLGWQDLSCRIPLSAAAPGKQEGESSVGSEFRV